MDETVRPLRIPPQMLVYADKHNVFHLLQSLVSSLIIDQPDDPIPYLISLLQRSNMYIPRILIVGPPAVGKHTLAKKLSAELRAVLVSSHTLLQGPSEETPADRLVQQIKQRLRETDCFNQGWVLAGIPKSYLQALRLQDAGIIPDHVVMLEAPDDVLLERSQGRLVDPVTEDIYHQTFICPTDETVARRLEYRHSLTDKHILTDLQHYRCEVTGLSSAYQHVLKTINADQPHNDIYQQALAFVQARHYSRTPRVLLLGPPGSGKSLQAKRLSNKYKMVDVCCSELLRSIAANSTDVGEKVRPYLNAGRPVPDGLVLQVLEDRLSQVDCSHRGWILHDCELQQARSLQESLYQPNKVFLLELTDDVCLERITLRSTDPITGQRYHTVSRPPPNSDVHSRLKTRPEDSIDTVTHALTQYRKHIAALQSVYPDVVHINADQDPHCVFEAIENKLLTD